MDEEGGVRNKRTRPSNCRRLASIKKIKCTTEV